MRGGVQMKYSVTKKDKKAVKVTCIVLAVLLLLLATLATVFGILEPKAEEKKSLGGEAIQGQVEGKDGSDYFLMTNEALYRYDAHTNDKMSVFYFSEIEEQLSKDGVSQDALRGGSLKNWKVTYAGVGDKDYFLAYDDGGNIFKLEDDGENLSVTTDYFLAKEKTIIKQVDTWEEKLYVLLAVGPNPMEIQQLDLLNLASGAVHQKILWEIDLANAETPAGYITLTPMVGASTGILSFAVTKDAIYIFKKGGVVFKLTPTLVDYVENGVGYNYMNAVQNYQQTPEYQEEYDKAYAQHFRDFLKNDEFYTEEELKDKTADELLAIVNELVENGELSVTTANGEKRTAKSQAEAAATNSISQNFPWYGGYIPKTGSVHVSAQYLNENNDYYSIVESGANLCGIVYSKKNDMIYYTNGLDGYVYSVTQKDINEAKMLVLNTEDSTKKPTVTTLNDIATRIDELYFGNKMFKTEGNGIALNKFANTLYLTFQNEKVIKIVDLNDTENYEVVYSYEGDFNIVSFIGDKDNDVTHVIREYKKWDTKGNPVTERYASMYKPAEFEKKSLFSTIFLVSLILAIVVFLLLIWFIVASKSERALMKMKVIKEDLKRHKWIYVALIPFVVLLILFCYYEAIGAIAMSFFNYTEAEPAWIWNEFGNYFRVFNMDLMEKTMNTLFFLFFDIILCIAPPLLFAFMLVLLRNQKLSGWFRSLMFLPGIIPSMATMLIWRQGILASDGGALNQVVSFFGGRPIKWLADENWSRWALVFMGFPFIGGYLIFYGGMINIPGEYHEAGRLEGLGVWKRLFCIDIPLILPQIKYIFIMTIIDSVQNYSRTYVLGSSGTTTLAEALYSAMMGTTKDYGLSSAYATIIFVCLFMAITANFKMQKKDTMGDDL